MTSSPPAMDTQINPPGTTSYALINPSAPITPINPSTPILPIDPLAPIHNVGPSSQAFLIYIQYPKLTKVGQPQAQAFLTMLPYIILVALSLLCLFQAF